MLQQLSSNKTISDIYFISNTPLPFYKMLRSNYFIQTELAKVPTLELIQEFERKAKSVETNEDLASLYAILVALTFKSTDEVRDFFLKVSQIKYEWFSEIAKYYLENPSLNISYNTVHVHPAETTTTTTTITPGLKFQTINQ